MRLPHNIPQHPIIRHENFYTTNPQVFPIKGMSYIPNFLDEQEQQELWDLIYQFPFTNIIRRRQQFYGDVYYHTTPNLSALQPKNQEKSLPMSYLSPWVNRLAPFFPDEPPDQVLGKSIFI